MLSSVLWRYNPAMRKITIEEQKDWLERRKAELGISGDNFAPSNNGKRRTASKRALLDELRELAERDGQEPPFKANF